MKSLQIPKKSGGFRTIYVQGPVEKHNYRYKGQLLAEFYEKNGTGAAHGFVSGKSPVSNAKKHLNKKFTLTVDLKDFFDSVTPDHLIKAGVDCELAKGVCYEGSARQGLSSSPAAANVAAIPLDKDIETVIPDRVTYTRYADDLTFSSDYVTDLTYLKRIIGKIIERNGFTINNKKTRIQSSAFGRRIITGIAVDEKINATKKIRKNLRSAKHNMGKLLKLLNFLNSVNLTKFSGLLLELNRKNLHKLTGLNEWVKLKEPTKSLGGKLITTAINIRTAEAFKEIAR